MIAEDKIFGKRGRRFKRKIPLSQEANKVIFRLILTLAVFIAALGTTLIITSSKSSQQGYVLKQAQIQNDKLRTKNEELKTKIVKVRSFQQIQKTNKVAEMKKIEERKYVVPRN